MGAGTVVRTGPSSAFQRIWAALPVWNPVPVMPTSWPALALIVERLTTGPETQAHAVAAMKIPAAAVVTPPIAHLRTCPIPIPAASLAERSTRAGRHDRFFGLLLRQKGREE